MDVRGGGLRRTRMGLRTFLTSVLDWVACVCVRCVRVCVWQGFMMCVFRITGIIDLSQYRNLGQSTVCNV